MSTLKAAILETLEEGLKLCKIHGVVNIAETKHLPVKLMWIFCVLASTGACSYIIILSIMGYLQYDVVTKMSINVQTSSEFPTVTICNSVPFVTKNSTSFQSSVLNNPPFSAYLNYTDQNLPIEPLKGLAQYFTNLNGKIQPDEVKKTFGLTLDQMLLSCIHSGKSCTSADFEWYYDLVYGNCFRFNSNFTSLKRTSNPGKGNGLRIELYVGSVNKVEINQQSTGAHIFVHNITTKPLPFEGNL